MNEAQPLSGRSAANAAIRAVVARNGGAAQAAVWTVAVDDDGSIVRLPVDLDALRAGVTADLTDAWNYIDALQCTVAALVAALTDAPDPYEAERALRRGYIDDESLQHWLDDGCTRLLQAAAPHQRPQLEADLAAARLRVMEAM